SRPPRQDAQSIDFEGSDSFEREINALRLELKDHPCHACSEKDQHMRWADRYWKLKKDTDKARRAIRGRTNTIATQFDKVCKVLEQFEYLVPSEGGEDFALTDSGRRLRRIYGDRDLLTSQILETGKLTQLNAEELCAVVASLVYQARRDGDRADPKMPTGKIDDIWNSTIKIWGELSDAEEALGLDPTAPPESGLIWPMYKWARGSSLNSALRGTDLAPGDFVRWAKQVIDTLDQFAKNSDLPPLLVRNAYKAVDQIKRGVVAYSTVLD
ncbi:MAG: RNA helicase, partial [Glutamicibacter sp.]